MEWNRVIFSALTCKHSNQKACKLVHEKNRSNIGGDRGRTREVGIEFVGHSRYGERCSSK